MPGWHDFTSEAREQGRVRMAGIVEEQHPDRANLFMQWKEMDWPLMVDSLNRLEVPAVPYTLFVDEAGIIRAVRPDEEDLEAFLERPPPEGADTAETIDVTAPDLEPLREGGEGGSPTERSRRADTLAQWGSFQRLRGRRRRVPLSSAGLPDSSSRSGEGRRVRAGRFNLLYRTGQPPRRGGPTLVILRSVAHGASGFAGGRAPVEFGGTGG